MEADRLISLPVRHRDVELGKVEGTLDLNGTRTLVLRVRCGDGAVRYLPAHAAMIADAEIRIASPLALLDEAAADFYRRVPD